MSVGTTPRPHGSNMSGTKRSPPSRTSTGRSICRAPSSLPMPEISWPGGAVGKLERAGAPARELSGDRQRAVAALRDASGILSASLERDASNDDARMHLAEAWGELGDLYGRIRPVNCGLLSDAYRRAIAATAPLKTDYPAGAMFDMAELRTHVNAQMGGCAVHAR